MLTENFLDIEGKYVFLDQGLYIQSGHNHYVHYDYMITAAWNFQWHLERKKIPDSIHFEALWNIVPNLFYNK